MVGGPGFEPGASRSRTAIALGSVRVARGRLGSGRPLLRSAKCRHVTADAAWVATCVATRFPTTRVPAVTTIRTSGGAEGRDQTRRSFCTPQAALHLAAAAQRSNAPHRGARWPRGRKIAEHLRQRWIVDLYDLYSVVIKKSYGGRSRFKAIGSRHHMLDSVFVGLANVIDTSIRFALRIRPTPYLISESRCTPQPLRHRT